MSLCFTMDSVILTCWLRCSLRESSSAWAFSKVCSSSPRLEWVSIISQSYKNWRVFYQNYNTEPMIEETYLLPLVSNSSFSCTSPSSRSATRSRWFCFWSSSTLRKVTKCWLITSDVLLTSAELTSSSWTTWFPRASSSSTSSTRT